MQQFFFKHRIIILVSSILILLGLSAGIIFLFVTPTLDTSTDTQSPQPSTAYTFDYSWVNQGPYVAHALGGINQDSYTNSLDAFYYNYQLGYRLFEADFSFTDDGHLVLAHDADLWRRHASFPSASIDPETAAFTYNNFMSSLIQGKYRPVDLSQFLTLMQAYPDFYLITDTKNTDETLVRQQFEYFVAAAEQIDSSLLDRFIIQIYSPEMLDLTMSIYPWKSVILTLYQYPDWTPQNIIEFTQSTGVKVITMWDYWVTPEIAESWRSAGITIAAHTVNDLTFAETLFNLDVELIYTDFLLATPSDS